MPELPEVETTRRGIKTALLNHTIKQLQVRERRLRWPVPDGLEVLVKGQRILALERRAKYILIKLKTGCIIWHLGMSGSMRIVEQSTELKKHDHIDLVMSNGKILRFNDPRRFGCVLWADEPVMAHPLLASLGPEPFDERFNAKDLYKQSRGRRVAIKNFIMDQKIVVGVGNIYASEALFLAGISPVRQARRVSTKRYARLVENVQSVLRSAIKQGGTSLRDFTRADGRPGYFKQQLRVYGRAGESCVQCEGLIRNKVIGQRASYYCPSCQH